MAKNKKIKNMKLEQNDLMPTTIGRFESRKRSSIGTVIILVIFIVFIWFLPQISDYVTELLHPTVVSPSTPNTPSKPTTPDEEDAKPQLVTYIENLKLTNSDLTVDNIVVDEDNQTITYTVTNNSNVSDVESLNYYLEIYNTDQTLIERVKLVSMVSMAPGTFRNFTKDIKEESASSIGYLMLIKKTIVEYPEVTLTGGEDGTGTIVCTRPSEKVTYKFTDNLLKEVISEVSHTNTEENYDDIYQEQTNLSNTYNNRTGITSTLFCYDAGYNITTTVNLNEAERTYIFNADTFKLNTEPKVVHFEEEAQGFTCN